jgi:hypothetical protein
MPRTIQRGRIAAACLLLLLPLPALAQREPPVQKELVERFGEWAEAYVTSLPSFTAHELVRQTHFGRRGAVSSQRSAAYQYTFQRSADNPREFEESRTRIAAAEGGNGAASSKPPDESSIGLFAKAALLVTRFAPRYHDRMKYFFVPDHPESVSDFVIVGYRQTSGSALMEVDGKEAFPIGRAWMDADNGRIVRIEEEFGQMGKTRYSVSVDFAADPVTRAWLPEKITVRIFDNNRLELQNEYSYSAFRPL